MQKINPFSIVFCVMAMACIALLDTTNKLALSTLPLVMVLWWRYAFQALSSTVFFVAPIGLGPV